MNWNGGGCTKGARFPLQLFYSSLHFSIISSRNGSCNRRYLIDLDILPFKHVIISPRLKTILLDQGSRCFDGTRVPALSSVYDASEPRDNETYFIFVSNFNARYGILLLRCRVITMQISINYKATKGRRDETRRWKFRKVSLFEESRETEREREKIKTKWNECLNLLYLNYVRIYFPI